MVDTLSLVPQTPLFASAVNRLNRVARSAESHRQMVTYLSASSLALMLGILPLVLAYFLRLTSINLTSFNALLILATVSLTTAYVIGMLPVLLILIVVATLIADRRFQYVYGLTRGLLEHKGLAIQVLEDGNALELADRQRLRLLPEQLSPAAGGDLLERADFFAHNFRHYERLVLAQEPLSLNMPLRHTPLTNIALVLLCSLLCPILLGYFLMPWLVKRLLVDWPTVSASRLAFAQFLHEQDYPGR